MKTRIFVAMMLAIFATVGMSFADVKQDVKIDIGIDQRQRQDQTQTQTQNQSQSSKNVNIQKGNFVTAPLNGFMSAGTAIAGSGWEIICAEMYMGWSTDDIGSAKYNKGFFDFITFDWGSNIEFTLIGRPLPSNSNPVSCLNYWPRWESRQGDRPLGSLVIVGKANMPNEAFVAQAYATCKERTGSSRVAIIGEINSDNVTTGSSLNIGGAISKIAGGGDSASAMTSGVGFGKARVRTEKYLQIQALCMNDIPVYTPPCPPERRYVPPAPPVIEAQPPPPTCNPEDILRRIAELKIEVQKCTRYCYNNLTLRNALGDAFIDLYVCTGDKRHLNSAIYNYEVAERNYRNGYDISAHKAEATQVIAQVYYSWAGCIKQVRGQTAAMSFAKTKKLERFPSGFGR